MTTWEQSYEGQLRRHVGSRKLLMPGARAFIQDGDGRTLFIKRRDNGRWGLPAGGKELDETLYETLEREVKEETGLDVVSATLIAVYSGSRFSGRNMFGNDYEHLVFQFRVDEWSGSLVRGDRREHRRRLLPRARVARALRVLSRGFRGPAELQRKTNLEVSSSGP